jgi:CubicO group peptidase (beta-lactamase class C family)
VVAGGKVEWARAYGTTSVQGGKPVTPDTLFQAASLSKSVAAMVALRLVEQGKLSLDEDVNLKLRSWKVPENEFTRTEKITLRRLLNHSAGLTVHGFEGYAAGTPVPSLVDVLDGKKPANSAAVRVNVMPGSKWRYSGGGYEVMQLLLQDVTGKPFAQLARELVLDPLGMKLSTYEQPLPRARAGEAATGHVSDGSVLAGNWHTYPEQAAAGLWTTPSELARMILEMQAGGRILKPESVNTLLTKRNGNYGLGFGLGDRDGRKSFAHGGANEGFRCQYFAYRDSGDGAVIMTNSDNGSELANEILRSLSAEYGWASYRQDVKTLARVDAAILQTYAGDYQVPDGPLVRIAFEDGRLFAIAPGPKKQLLPESAERFFTLEGGLPPFEFVRKDGGEMELHSGDAPVAKRVRP